MNRKSVGRSGEETAERFLKNLSYKLLDRNFNTRWGELDMVARDRDVIVFVEVKARTETDFARPEESVTSKKQVRLRKAAQLWLAEHYKRDVPVCRFDVVSVTFDRDGNETVEHFKNAFT